MNSSDLAVVAAIAAEEASARIVESNANAMDTDEQNKPATIALASEEPKDTIDKAINEGAKEEDYESSDLESSSSSEEEEGEEEEKRSVGAWGDDGEDDISSMEILRTTNEVTEIVVEKPDFDIKPNMTLSRIGHIHEVIDKVIVIQSDTNIPALDMGTLFTYSDRSIMGEVFETFGPVFKPFYSVLFNSADEIDASKAVIGSEVLFVADYERTKVVPTEELRKMKYTDASNMHDEEISGSDEEFSDDEAELQHKRSKKKRRRKAKGSQNVNNNEWSPAKGKPHNSQLKRKRFFDEPDDFDSALAAYEHSNSRNTPGPSVVPQRQVQSYADIFDSTPNPFATQPPASPMSKQYDTTTAATQPYMSPEELVRAHHREKKQMAPQTNLSRPPAGYNNSSPVPTTTAATATTTAATNSAATSAGVTSTVAIGAFAEPLPPPQIQFKQLPEQPEKPQQQQQQQQQTPLQPQEGSARAVLLAMLQSSQTPK